MILLLIFYDLRRLNFTGWWRWHFSTSFYWRGWFNNLKFCSTHSFRFLLICWNLSSSWRWRRNILSYTLEFRRFVIRLCLWSFMTLEWHILLISFYGLLQNWRFIHCRWWWFETSLLWNIWMFLNFLASYSDWLLIFLFLLLLLSLMLEWWWGWFNWPVYWRRNPVLLLNNRWRRRNSILLRRHVSWAFTHSSRRLLHLLRMMQLPLLLSLFIYKILMSWWWRWKFLTLYLTLNSSFINLLQRCMAFSMILLASLLVCRRYSLGLRFKSRWWRYFFRSSFLYIRLLFLLYFGVDRRLISDLSLRRRRHNGLRLDDLMLFFLLFIENWRSWHIFIFCWDIRIWRMLLISNFWWSILLNSLFFTSLALCLILFWLHNRNINLFENNTVSVLLKIFGCMNDHINFFDRFFINIVTKNDISNHFEVLLSCYKSSFSDNFVETFTGLNIDSKSSVN